MDRRLEGMVARLRGQQADAGEEQGELGCLSAGQRCYVALAADRYDILPHAYDPVEAWHRLGPDWQQAVCLWRGWPEDWTRLGTLREEVGRVCVVLDAAGVPGRGGAGLHALAGRVRWLTERLRQVASDHGGTADG